MTPLQERFLRQYFPEHAVEKLRGIAIKIHDFRFAGLGLKVAFGGQLYFWHDFRGAWAKVPPATADLIAEIKTPSLLLAEDLRRDIILRSRERYERELADHVVNPPVEAEPRIYLRQSDVQDIFDLLVMLREETQSRSVHERATRLVELLEPMLEICRGEIA